MSIKGLDDIDLKVISALTRDARTAHEELARMCGVTRQTISSRIRKLETEGIIKGYRAVVDYERIGLVSYFMLFLKLDVSDVDFISEYLRTIKDDPHILMDVSITGEWDVMLLLAFHDVREYESYISDLRMKMGPRLKDSKSHVILNFYKTPDEYVP